MAVPHDAWPHHGLGARHHLVGDTACVPGWAGHDQEVVLAQPDHARVVHKAVHGQKEEEEAGLQGWIPSLSCLKMSESLRLLLVLETADVRAKGELESFESSRAWIFLASSHPTVHELQYTSSACVHLQHNVGSCHLHSIKNDQIVLS